jgi:hypothetical protein
MTDAVTNVASPAGGVGFDTYAAPLFTTKRFAGMKEFVVPEIMYNKMRYGREPGARWATYVEDEGLQNELRTTFHKDEKLLLTCDNTGRSIILRKKKIARQAAMPEFD